ncbi:MAG: alpha/beta hydrolase [Pseudomonadota bacterium]
MDKRKSRILSAIMFQVRSRPSFESIGVVRYRQLLEQSARIFTINPAIKKDPIHICGMDAEWITPPEHDEKRIILYVHGGGFIAGSINSHRDLASRIATAAKARLLMFNYRLAPEHPFPAGLDDTRQIYQWITERFDNSHHICLAGDSAGAGLALSLVSDLMTRALPLPKCVVLLSPWTDLECKNLSHHTNLRKDFMLNQKALKATARLYTDKDLANPLISPINNNFKGFPPVLIQVGENEVLLDDSTLLAKKIEQDNGIVKLEVWDEMFHVWHYFSKYLSQARDAVNRAGEFIQFWSPVIRSSRARSNQN